MNITTNNVLRLWTNPFWGYRDGVYNYPRTETVLGTPQLTVNNIIIRHTEEASEISFNSNDASWIGQFTYAIIGTTHFRVLETVLTQGVVHLTLAIIPFLSTNITFNGNCIQGHVVAASHTIARMDSSDLLVNLNHPIDQWEYVLSNTPNFFTTWDNILFSRYDLQFASQLTNIPAPPIAVTGINTDFDNVSSVALAGFNASAFSAPITGVNNLIANGYNDAVLGAVAVITTYSRITYQNASRISSFGAIGFTHSVTIPSTPATIIQNRILDAINNVEIIAGNNNPSYRSQYLPNSAISVTISYHTNLPSVGVYFNLVPEQRRLTLPVTGSNTWMHVIQGNTFLINNYPSPTVMSGAVSGIELARQNHQQQINMNNHNFTVANDLNRLANRQENINVDRENFQWTTQMAQAGMQTLGGIGNLNLGNIMSGAGALAMGAIDRSFINRQQTLNSDRLSTSLAHNQANLALQNASADLQLRAAMTNSPPPMSMSSGGTLGSAYKTLINVTVPTVGTIQAIDRNINLYGLTCDRVINTILNNRVNHNYFRFGAVQVTANRTELARIAELELLNGVRFWNVIPTTANLFTNP